MGLFDDFDNLNVDTLLLCFSAKSSYFYSGAILLLFWSRNTFFLKP